MAIFLAMISSGLRSILQLGCLLVIFCSPITAYPVFANSAHFTVLSHKYDEQRFSIAYRLIPLDQALGELSELTGIDILYDSRLTINIILNGSSANKTVEEILDDMLRNTRLRFRRSPTGTYLIYQVRGPMANLSSISGIIRNSATKDPISGVNVYIESVERGSTTNAEGSFLIDRLTVGTYLVRVSHVAFEPRTIRVSVSASIRQHIDVELIPAAINVEQVVITDLVMPLPNMRAGQDFAEPDPLFLETSSGSPDALRILSEIPGVRFQNPLSDMLLQGSHTAQHRIKLEGKTVFGPLSMGRILSAFSPYAVRRLRLYKAGFPASQGSSLSGVIAVEQSALNLNNADPYLLQTDLNALNFRAYNYLDFKDGQQLNLMTAVRTHSPWSLQHPAVSKTLDSFNTADPLLLNRLSPNPDRPHFFSSSNAGVSDYSLKFYDLHFSALQRHTDLSSTTLTLYAGESSIESELRSTQNTGAGMLSLSDGYNWQNQIFNLRHNRLINLKGAGSVSAGLSRHQYGQNYSGGLLLPDSDDWFSNKSNILLYKHGVHHLVILGSLAADYTHEWDSSYQLTLGIEASLSKSEASFSDFPGGEFDFDEKQYLLTFYSESEWFLTSRSQLIAGMRISMPGSYTFYAEPRIAYGIDFPDTDAGNISVNIAAGLFREFMKQLPVANLSPNGLYASNRFWIPVSGIGYVPYSWHLSGDIRWQPYEPLMLRVEPYMKWEPNSPVIAYPALMQNTLDSPGKAGHSPLKPKDIIELSEVVSTGIGISAEWSRTTYSFGLVYNYLYLRQKFSDRYNNRFIEPYWSEPHQITLSSRLRLFTNTTFTSRIEIMPSSRGWAWRQAYYDVLAFSGNNSYNELFGSPLEDRIEPRYQLDIGLNWSRQFPSSSVSITAEIINLLGNSNEFDRGLRSLLLTPSETYSRSISHMQPGISIQLTF
ncbi:MAG: carboxypeptidase-like regulatory domain-containing protein [Balneolales bacterium]|nr:carboxypeptidase-like regulatory domain-containing protein [Balneolales bacterium]